MPCLICQIAFFVDVPKFDRIADAEEQIRVGSDYLNKGSLDMVRTKHFYEFYLFLTFHVGNE